MFRTKFPRVVESVFYLLGGHNAFNHSKAIDKLEGYVSPLFAAISAKMEGPNRDKYGFIYRVRARTMRFEQLALTLIFFAVQWQQRIQFHHPYRYRQFVNQRQSH